MTFEEFEDNDMYRERCNPTSPMFFFLAVIAILLFSVFSGGCTTYKGGKIVEGTDIAAGMSVPQSGGTIQIDALNFLTGFRFLFAEDSSVHCAYTTTNTVSFFGIYSSSTKKSIEIDLNPTIDTPQNTQEPPATPDDKGESAQGCSKMKDADDKTPIATL